MKVTVYYLVCDAGDGSAHVEFFLNKENAEKLIDENSDEWDESYNLNDSGVRSFQFEGEISGIHFQDA